MGLAIEVTPDIDRYHEALDWFGKRTVITRDEARRLDDNGKREAFWVGGGLHLAQVQRVFDELNKAIERGDTLEMFKKSIRDTLRDPHHVETVFRNAAQRAYNAGRWAQMREPNTARYRPYWLVDAVLDGRTTQYCRLCNQTLLPWDSPWWQTHWFPAHHRCRTSVRNLTLREAERRGLTKLPPDDQHPPPGWGLSPERAQQWKPDPKDHDKQLLLDFGAQEQKSVKKRKPVAPPPPAPAEPELDLKTWVPHYEPQYGAEAAKSVGHGRAALELGLDMKVGDVLDQLDKLPEVGLKRLAQRALVGADRERTLREQTGELEVMRKVAAAVAGHLRTLKKRAPIQPRNFPTPEQSAAGARTREFYEAFSGPSVQHPEDWTFTYTTGRASADHASKRIRYDLFVGTFVHEWAHAVEKLTPELEPRAFAFLAARTKGKKLESLRSLTGFKYRRDEKARDGGFFDYYVGKDYSFTSGEVWATEIMSMGVEMLVAGHCGSVTLSQAATMDLDHLLFVIGQLAGP